MNFGSLFAGIGGFDLGLERAGMACKWQVEIDPFCNKVLAKHWPNVKRYGDIENVGKHNLKPVELICGGFPCQPFSFAGKQRGKEDDRYLWPEMLRVISEVRPTWIIGENVAGIIRLELDQVLSDLEAQGYETQAFIIPACGVDAPHRRDRVWILAYSKNNRNRFQQKGKRHKRDELYSHRRSGMGDKSYDSNKVVANADRSRQKNHQGSSQIEEFHRDRTTGGRGGAGGEYARWFTESEFCGISNGFSEGLDEYRCPKLERLTLSRAGRADRLKALGNAVVPRIVEIIGRFIMDIENEDNK